MCNIFFNGCIGREKIFSTRFLIMVLYGHFNYWKYFFRRFLTLFSTVSTVENNQVSCSENTTNKKRREETERPHTSSIDQVWEKEERLYCTQEKLGQKVTEWERLWLWIKTMRFESVRGEEEKVPGNIRWR